MRLRFYGIPRDVAANVALDVLGSSRLTEEDAGTFTAES
jgi:hypothetical protein